MKKYTLLFTMLFTMSMAFGQKELEKLWEKEIFEFTPSAGGSSTYLNGLQLSSNGNIFVRTLVSGNFYFDKNGNKMGLSNLNTPFNANTHPILNKDFEVVGTIDLSKTTKGTWSLYEEEDGLVVVNLDNDKTVKYDYNGKEVWRYNHGYAELKHSLLKDYYFFLDYKNSYLSEYKASILNKKGIKTGEMTLDYNPHKVFPSNDKSIWILKYNRNNSEFMKYDSTGNKLQVIIPKTYSFDDAFVFSPQNSVVMSSISVDGKRIIFTRTDIKGNVKIVSKKTDESINFIKSYNRSSSYYIKMEMIDENKFRFIIDCGLSSIMGLGSFEDSNFGWIREEIRPVMAKNSFITSGNYSMTSYNLDGSEKWSLLFSEQEEYPLLNYGSYDYLDSPVYIRYKKENQSYISKIQIEDGKTIWTQTVSKEETVEVKQDSEKNDYLIYRKNIYGPPHSFRIILISKLTQKASKFYDSSESVWGFSLPLVIDFKSKTLLTAPAISGSQLGRDKYTLRKYSIRCVYDTEAEVLGKTEICSDKKVSVSTSKQDGLTYQWQKDGKNIPTYKDFTHDVEESGIYTVTVKDEICQNQTTSNPIKVTIRPTPESIISTDTKGVVYEPFTVKMSANSGTGLAYQWLKDDAIIPNETKANYEAKKSGKYNVNVTYDGCSKLSDALTISILIPLANSEEIGEEVVQVYPNPSKGEFKIILPKSLKSADVQLFDVLGRERSLMYVGEQAQAEGLTQGVYFLRVQKGEKSVVNKIVIE